MKFLLNLDYVNKIVLNKILYQPELYNHRIKSGKNIQTY